MTQPQNVPDPCLWWDETAAEHIIGSREQGLLATVNGDGAFDGPMTIFRDGEPLIESNWAGGKLHGTQTIWRPPFYRTGQFADGVPHGRWTLYWNQHALVWNEYESGVVTNAARENQISRTIAAEPKFIVNGAEVGSMDEALAMGDAVETLGFSGWAEAALPEEIWELRSLRQLQIYYSHVAPIPAGIGNLEHLELLEIKSCNIGWIDPAIGKLKNLKELRVIESGLGVFPAVTSPKLRTIDVSGNIMSRVGHSLAECTALTMLKMRDNYIMTLDENVFSAPALSMLDMNASFWVSWISPAVGTAKGLVNLTLYEQSLLSLPDELSECTALQTLNLYGAHVVDPPTPLGANPIGQLNLDQTPLHIVPGYEDFEAGLREAWATKDEAVAEQVALEKLSVASLGLDPPKVIAPFEAASVPNGETWSWGYSVESPGARTDWVVDGESPHETYAALQNVASGVFSGDIGCESGDEPVRALLGPSRTVDVPLTELLIQFGYLQQTDIESFRALGLQLEGSPLVDAIAALGPVETWALEVLPHAPEDLKVPILLAQLDANIWVAIGPTPRDDAAFSSTPDIVDEFEPGDGELRKLVMREVNSKGGAQLCFHNLDRQVGERSTVVFDTTRHRVLARYLLAAGFCAVRPLDVAAFEQGGKAFVELGSLLAELEAPQHIILGAVALYPQLFIGQSATGEVAGVATETVMT